MPCDDFPVKTITTRRLWLKIFQSENAFAKQNSRVLQPFFNNLQGVESVNIGYLGVYFVLAHGDQFYCTVKNA